MLKNSDDQDKVCEVQNSTNLLIREAKQAYYEKLGNKLSNLQTGQKGQLVSIQFQKSHK